MVRSQTIQAYVAEPQRLQQWRQPRQYWGSPQSKELGLGLVRILSWMPARPSVSHRRADEVPGDVCDRGVMFSIHHPGFLMFYSEGPISRWRRERASETAPNR